MFDSYMTTSHAKFLQAIEEQNKVRIEFYPKTGTEVLQLTCVPLEYGQGGEVQDGMDRYWFWDYSSNNTQILGLLPRQIVAFTVLDEEFTAIP